MTWRAAPALCPFPAWLVAAAILFILLLLLLLLVGAQCPEWAGGRDPECRVRCLFLCPQLVPGAPSPSSPPPPLPSPALPLVPGSLRRTHHDGRRRAAPDSVSTRDGGCQAPRGPGTAERCGREQESGAEAGALGGSLAGVVRTPSAFLICPLFLGKEALPSPTVTSWGLGLVSTFSSRAFLCTPFLGRVSAQQRLSGPGELLLSLCFGGPRLGRELSPQGQGLVEVGLGVGPQQHPLRAPRN